MPQIHRRSRTLRAPDWRRCLVLLALAIPSASQAEWADWTLDTDVSVVRNNNISLAVLDRDKLTDTIFAPAITAGRAYQLGTHSRLHLTANLEAEVYRKYDDVSNTRLGGGVGLWHKFGTGPTQPWLRADVSARSIASHDKLRDGAIYWLGLRGGKRFSNRLDGWIEYQYTRRDGKDGDPIAGLSGPGTSSGTDPFDLAYSTLTAKLDYLLAERVLLGATVISRKGDYVSSCNCNNAAAILAKGVVIEAVTVDEAYREVWGKTYCAHRQEGDGFGYTLGLSHTLSRASSINLGYEAFSVKSAELKYDAAAWRLGFLYAY